jgi:hypothetical protein
MTAEQLRAVIRAQPFQPFTIHFAGDRELVVRHPDFVWVSPTGRMALVELPDGAIHHVDLFLVTDLEIRPLPPAPPTANGT